MGRTWILLPYLMSGKAFIDTMSPRRTLRLFLTHLFIQTFSGATLLSDRATQTVCFLRLPVTLTVSPRKRFNSFIVVLQVKIKMCTNHRKYDNRIVVINGIFDNQTIAFSPGSRFLFPKRTNELYKHKLIYIVTVI